MATTQIAQGIRDDINGSIITNGQGNITADTLRPLLLDMLKFTQEEVGDRNALETDEKDDLVGAINEVLSKINSPGTFTIAPVQVLTLTQPYEILGQFNQAIHEVLSTGVVGGLPIQITIPLADVVTTPETPAIGSHYDFFQVEQEATPIFVVQPGVTIITPPGERLVFTGRASGIRLLKVEQNVWRFIRLTGLRPASLTGEVLNVLGKGDIPVSEVEQGDTVITSRLNNDILLIHGDFDVGTATSKDPLNLDAYDENSRSYFDPNDN